LNKNEGVILPIGAMLTTGGCARWMRKRERNG
jgi:hypothetical protein